MSSEYLTEQERSDYLYNMIVLGIEEDDSGNKIERENPLSKHKQIANLSRTEVHEILDDFYNAGLVEKYINICCLYSLPRFVEGKKTQRHHIIPRQMWEELLSTRPWLSYELLDNCTLDLTIEGHALAHKTLLNNSIYGLIKSTDKMTEIHRECCNARNYDPEWQSYMQEKHWTEEGRAAQSERSKNYWKNNEEAKKKQAERLSNENANNAIRAAERQVIDTLCYLAQDTNILCPKSWNSYKKYRTPTWEKLIVNYAYLLKEYINDYSTNKILDCCKEVHKNWKDRCHTDRFPLSYEQYANPNKDMLNEDSNKLIKLDETEYTDKWMIPIKNLKIIGDYNVDY